MTTVKKSLRALTDRGSIGWAAGFSGLEMTIIVVILGLAFSMALKGRDLVDSFRAFKTASTISEIQGRVAAYQSEFGSLPGDDPRGSMRFGRPIATFFIGGGIVSFEGDEKLDGKLSDMLNANGEQFMIWADLRGAKMVDGDPKLTGGSAMPENPFGGIYGFDEGNLGPVKGSLCATKIPGAAAAAIDQKLDDGVIGTGRVVATSKYDPVGALNHFNEPDSEPYNVDKEYIICVPMMP